MLVRRLRRRPGIKTTLDNVSCLLGKGHLWDSALMDVLMMLRRLELTPGVVSEARGHVAGVSRGLPDNGHYGQTGHWGGRGIATSSVATGDQVIHPRSTPRVHPHWPPRLTTGSPPITTPLTTPPGQAVTSGQRSAGGQLPAERSGAITAGGSARCNGPTTTVICRLLKPN